MATNGGEEGPVSEACENAREGGDGNPRLSGGVSDEEDAREWKLTGIRLPAGQQREVRHGPCVTTGSHSFYLPPTHGP